MTGPCVTFLIPAYRPASQDGSQKDILKGLLDRAEQQLRAGSHAADAPGLLKPVQEMLAQSELERGGPGFVVFRSAEAFLRLKAPEIRQAQVIVASHATVAPLLEAAFAPQEFFVLGLSQKKLRFLSYQYGVCEEAALPEGIPANPAEAMAFDTPQRDLNRSTPAGHAGGAPFGTDTEREKTLKHLHDFFKMLDRDLHAAVEGRPVLLAGVKAELAEFRKTAKHLNLLETEIEGNIDRWGLPRIGEEAHKAAGLHFLEQGEAAFENFQAISIGDRKLTGPEAILEAAEKGRIHQLCVRRNTALYGRVPIPLNKAHVGEEDLVNAACAITLAKGGEVFVVETDRMNAKQPLGAALRY